MRLQLVLWVGIMLALALPGLGQSYVFAELSGTPLNTSGWNLQGNAYVGNTGINTGSGELILTNPQLGQSGSAFFNVPINLNTCNKWVTEFEFRIAEGTAADGIAFCYLDVPPTGFVSGGGIGIPATANGLKVCIDTWRNCGTDAVPKIQLRWGATYNECASQPTRDNNDGALNFIRSGAYHKARIEYDKGNIRVLINNLEMLTGFQTFNFTGYFGFTASTGGFTDRHSIRNVRIYTEMPPSDAGSNQSVCQGDSVSIGASPNPDYVYAWSPSAGLSNTTVANPRVSFKNTSTGNITRRYFLRTEFANLPGCGSSDSVDVVFFPAPELSINTSGSCQMDSIRFSGITQWPEAANAGLKWQWDFNDPNANASNPNQSTQRFTGHTYSVIGNYTVNLKATTDKSCVAEANLPLTILAKPRADFSVAPLICATRDGLFTDASNTDADGINRWYWTMGDGKTLENNSPDPFNHNYQDFGPKQVSLVVASPNGCISDTLSKTIMVHAQPEAGFELPEVCLNDAFAQFTNTTKIADGSLSAISWSWHFGDPNATGINPNTGTDQNPRHRYSAVGQYPVSLLAVSPAGCRDSLSQNLVVNGDKPKADFLVLNAAALCVNTPVSVQNKSSVNFGSVTKTEIYWQWPDVSVKTVDDDPKEDKIYQHQYADFNAPAAKTVQIKLVAFSGGVCVNETIRDITLQASPKAVFQTIPGICLDAAPRTLTQGSDVSGLPGAGSYSGLGVSAGGQFNPATAGVGTHQIQYLFTTNQGCRDSVSAPITVWPRPQAGFMPDSPTCANRIVSFTDTSKANFSKLEKWIWHYGDGTLDTLGISDPFRHIYSDTGKYMVRLMVITDSGCTSLPDSAMVRIYPVPRVDFSLPVVCLPVGKGTFTNNTNISDGSLGSLKYQWHFGTGNAPSTDRDPVFYFPSTGPYPIKLVVTSGMGCIDSLTKTLSDINPQPRAGADVFPPSVCLGSSVSLSENNNALGQGVVKRFWDMGDGQKDTTAQLLYIYRQPGTYTIRYYFESGKGCYSDTLSLTAVIHPFPVVNAGPDLLVLEGSQATIKATATGSSGYVYKWNPAIYLDYDTVLQPVVKPAADMFYRLAVTGTGGCTSYDNVLIKLLLKPEVPNAFSPNGDGINDVWNIKHLQLYPEAVVQVFDRYGKRVYYRSGSYVPWDGKYLGADLPVGVYYYIIEPKNGRLPSQGSVTILR